MTTIKANPDELRGLARDLRHSGSQLRQLGDHAIAAAASANSPAAIGTMGEAASFATGARLSEIETGFLATGTERVADLFEAADNGWFAAGLLMGAAGSAGGFLSHVQGLGKLYKVIPHNARRSSWAKWGRAFRDGRTKVARHFGRRNAASTLRSWGQARLKTLSHPKAALAKFAREGTKALRTAGRANDSLWRRVAPLGKFGLKAAGKVLKPFNIIQTYKASKAGSTPGKVTSVVFSTLVTKNPVGLVADIVTGGQVTKGADGIVSTIANVGDADRLAEMSVANAKGENGWAMQGIQFAGDGLATGIYGGWSWLTNGR